MGVWSSGLRRHPDLAARHSAARDLEAAGYSGLWIPGGSGGAVFQASDELLRATAAIAVGIGIVNIWMHDPAEVRGAYTYASSAYGRRFILGLGVSHPDVVDVLRPGTYAHPLAAMTGFLDALDGTPPAPPRILAALGPRMLELARRRAQGAHPYLTTPGHTRVARAALGPDSFLAPVQTVVLERRPDRARAIARRFLDGHFRRPNYCRLFRSLGFAEHELAGGGSDRIVDAVVAWGDADSVSGRVEEHLRAGADHVCVQVLSDDARHDLPMAAWATLAGQLCVPR